jgi:hypothetical protein
MHSLNNSFNKNIKLISNKKAAQLYAEQLLKPP